MYISAYAVMPVSVCLTEVQWRIMANLDRCAASVVQHGRRTACELIISRHASQC